MKMPFLRLALTKHGARAALAMATFAAALLVPQTLFAADKAAGTTDPIPGPRTCFWSRGPVSADPYINIAYPDAAAFYWAATFTVPEGAKLSLDGEFPHSRYMSFISYDAKGAPIESVADYLIKPVAGSGNPYVVGADRSVANRSYSFGVISSLPDPKRKEGVSLAGESRDAIHAPKYGPGQQEILYRIYARDHGTDETGNAGLPTPVLTMADGSVLKGAEACGALKVRQPLALDPTALAVPMEKYRQLVHRPGKPDTHPATNPSTWYIQYDRNYLYSIYTGTPLKNARKSEGGFYPNPDNQYIRTILNRKFGKVYVVRGKAPTTPKTVNGDSKMGTGELRYWSMCTNQGFANTRVNDCVHDEQVPVGRDGNYTIVVSRKADRPRNATTECGVAWLPMADDGDGAFDNDVTVLQLRNMLGTPSFPHGIQAIEKPGDEAKVMGPYFPKGQYMGTSAFEIAVPCVLESNNK